MKKILIIGATTRPGRMAVPVLAWLKKELTGKVADIEFTAIDLAKLNLPFLARPGSIR